METEALRWFQQVADGMTVTEVGDLEMVSQPAVSRALARLEKHLIRSMHVDRPGVQFALTQVTDDPAGTPAAARADLVLGSRAPGPGYRSHPLTSEPLRLVTATEHRLRRRLRDSLSDVAGEPYVVLRSNSAQREHTL